MSKRTIKEVKENLNNIHGNKFVLLSEELPRYKEKLLLYCTVCGNTFNATYDNLINKGSGCPYCAHHIKSNDEFISELQTLFGNKLIYNSVDYINAKTAVTIICPKHGVFYKTPNKLLRGQGCPKCKVSKLENIVMNELITKNIQFETQKRFKWLGKQSLDFFLPNYNVAIECQGEQHFHQVYFNGKTNNIEERNTFKSIKSRDEEKYILCKQHSLKLLYFIDNKILEEEIIKNPIYEENYFYKVENIINKINEK